MGGSPAVDANGHILMLLVHAHFLHQLKYGWDGVGYAVVRPVHVVQLPHSPRRLGEKHDKDLMCDKGIAQRYCVYTQAVIHTRARTRMYIHPMLPLHYIQEPFTHFIKGHLKDPRHILSLILFRFL